MTTWPDLLIFPFSPTSLGLGELSEDAFLFSKAFSAFHAEAGGSRPGGGSHRCRYASDVFKQQRMSVRRLLPFVLSSACNSPVWAQLPHCCSLRFRQITRALVNVPADLPRKACRAGGISADLSAATSSVPFSHGFLLLHAGISCFKLPIYSPVSFSF